MASASGVEPRSGRAVAEEKALRRPGEDLVVETIRRSATEPRAVYRVPAHDARDFCIGAVEGLPGENIRVAVPVVVRRRRAPVRRRSGLAVRIWPLIHDRQSPAGRQVRALAFALRALAFAFPFSRGTFAFALTFGGAGGVILLSITRIGGISAVCGGSAVGVVVVVHLPRRAGGTIAPSVERQGDGHEEEPVVLLLHRVTLLRPPGAKKAEGLPVFLGPTQLLKNNVFYSKNSPIYHGLAKMSTPLILIVAFLAIFFKYTWG